VRRVRWARSARAAAASVRSTLSISTQRPREWMRGRASAASRRMSSAVSSTSSKTADQRTSASWWAPTTDASTGSAVRRSAGLGLRRERAGTRMSKPAAYSDGPVTPMSSKASSWLRTTSPRRWPPGRLSTGRSRSRRTVSSARWRFDRPSTRATSRGTMRPSWPGPSTERNQAPPLSGGSSWTTRRASTGPRTGSAQRSRRSASGVARRAGAAKGVPFRLVTTASATSPGVRTTGGGAGSSRRPAASRTMASTVAPRTSRVRLRASVRSRAATGPGMARDRASSLARSTSAGAHATANAPPF
jgi:hypothetical protein